MEKPREENQAHFKGVVSAMFSAAAVMTLVCPASRLAAQPLCDPEMTEKIPSLDPGWRHFGASVAISEDGQTFLAGAPHDDTHGTRAGVVDVFHLDEGGTWIRAATLADPVGNSYDEFGSAVALRGDTAIIGAYRSDDGGAKSGSAHVFNRNDQGEWVYAAELLPHDSAPYQHFGGAIEMQDDLAVIAAPWDDERGGNAGAAYVFHRDDNGVWTEVAKITAEDGVEFAAFGSSVSIADRGDTIVAGARGDPVHGTETGSVYVFVRQGDRWYPHSKLTAPDGEEYDNFGENLVLKGDTLFVGAMDSDMGRNSGSVYVFERDALGAWIFSEKLTAPDGSISAWFGYSMTLHDNFALISAPWDDADFNASGSVYVFRRDALGNWYFESKLVAEDRADTDYFGYDIASNGTDLVVGAYGDEEGFPNAGSVYLYKLHCQLALSMSGACPGEVTFTIEGITPSSRAAILYGLGDRFVIPDGVPCTGTSMEVGNPYLGYQVVWADAAGRAEFTARVPNGACGHLNVQAIDLTSCATSNVVQP